MSGITIVTERIEELKKDPLLKLYFKFFNMWTQGVWLVDPQHSMFEVIKKTAIEVAKTAGDLKTYNELINS